MRLYAFSSYVVIVSLCLVAGCKDDACKGEPPSMQVTVELGPEVDVSKLDKAEVHVLVAERSKVAQLALGKLKSEGSAAFVVVVGDAGAAGFTAEVKVSVFGSANDVVAEGSATFTASGDGCNDYSLRLFPPSGTPPADGAGPCHTAPLASGKGCERSAPAGFQQAYWDSNTGSERDQQSCALVCTSWGIYNVKSNWCCELLHNGTSWVCSVYGTSQMQTEAGDFYAALGQCTQ